jgi:predicted RNase H-like nuclease (RuvC/YqgF family)
MQPIEVAEKMEAIELKVKQLGLNVERLRMDNANLRRENERLKAELDHLQRGTVAELKEKLETAQRRLEGNRNGEEVPLHQLRDELDQYIQEIDTCIAWLEKQ